MDIIIFMLIYLVVLVATIGFEVYILFNNKVQYLKTSYKALENICKLCDSNNPEVLAREINRFYEEYVQEDTQTKKFFPNVVVWIDAIIFRIDCGNKNTSALKPYESKLKDVRCELEKQNPFNKCEKYQQGILRDIKKLELDENKIVVENILNRTEEEFIRMSLETKKNRNLNVLSITITIISIIITIVMAFV